ncbi:hypothetical protein LSH36_2605g00000 [Paralvinella palmiformis]|uniref:Sulfotransferase domain-containing protein n=1 Tax=Paralvinella palmiformis TaxID=53620 RepID=A0AAD9MNF0_9ANNE|nr:hypothetical protein LSH36_2605g00000 [Paralvinella palmiformis]
MEVLPYLQLFGTITAWVLFMIFNSFYNVIRRVYWRYTGVHQQLLASRKPENYNKSAHVKEILFRRTIDTYIKHPEGVFLTVHEGFVNPERVFQDDCSLYAITPTEAIFIQVKNRPDELFLHDFLWIGQFAVADKLISIPLIHFNKLAEDMEDEGAKIIFLHNQARGGGTLVTALFRETGRCVCFNEPPCIMTLCKHLFDDHIWHGATARRMLRNTIRLLCKPYGALEERVVAYVIKPMVLNMIIVEMAQEVFPEAIQFFIYRDPIEVTKSLRRIGNIIKPLKLLIHLPNYTHVVQTILELIGQSATEFRGWECAIHPEFELGYRATCFTVYYYLEALKRGIDIHGVRYEDLVTCEDNSIQKIFQICQFPDSFIEKAKAAMVKDSQANSPISREKVQDALQNPVQLPPGFWDVARAMSEEYGIPGPDAYQDKSFRLSNSLQP